MARLASGHGVGLVLSGGGARGFAHLGAVRALREAGVPIDAVGGCSMGAPIAGGVALDLDDDEMITLAEDQFHKLLDYTVPVVALLKGERISKNIDASFGGWDVEDLWLPYYCVSTNLTKSTLEVHRRGSVSQAIRASVAIPGVLPPVPVDGDLLVDGGVLNNMPAEIMRLDSTIGTVDRDRRRARSRARAPAPTSARRCRGSARCGRRCAARQTEYPSVTSVLLRSMLTGAVHNQERSLRDGVVDLMVKMHLPGVGLLEFERVREVAAFGYDDSVEQIREWAARATVDRGAVVILLTLRDLRFRAVRFVVVVLLGAVVFALLFVMTGLVEQFNLEPYDTVDAFGASTWVLPEGVSGSVHRLVDDARGHGRRRRRRRDVAAVVTARSSITAGSFTDEVVLVGHEPGGLGSPPTVEGRAAAAPGEVAVDESMDVDVGDAVNIGGDRLHRRRRHRRTRRCSPACRSCSWSSRTRRTSCSGAVT